MLSGHSKSAKIINISLIMASCFVELKDIFFRLIAVIRGFRPTHVLNLSVNGL